MHLEPDDVTRALQAFGDASRELLARVSRQQGLGTTDVTALYLLEGHGPLGVAELSERLGIRTASTTVLVDRLAAAGHVHRQPHPTDRRRTLVVLDEGARAANEAAWSGPISQLDAVSRSLTPAQRDVVLAFLRRATTALEHGATGS
ncbi:MarR family winged helix-turn-helix transcriptional regulator [Streptomyces sp. NP160]|uniref:MarR family winged helix-turn-helix transcriptional regulator n=1 Tax=Streptomyces sp. NP160 TaxID=2586637 RepID=UPI0015D6031D|nr:MarR family transcriptional regulator [Streptomyces sp. NP160]